MQITITQIARNNKTSKVGKPYVSVGIKCNEYGDKYINGFGHKDNASWKIGDTVDVEIVEKGEYLNFEMPKSTFIKAGQGFTPSPDLLRVERKIDAILTEMQMMKSVMGDILSKVDKGVTGF